ncbi:polysaccharide deacetylase family protein [Pullulanibacillus sp. KACC 23026]|uniref:polysaccharide deacetylase family protein n=1 Tax=Pullulanibacillus sp. KACC 23026 TaxID=3028315 RepID=UPI0023B16689|nr:polysaccharide deacetylase family protein [Pullulanibacillus sp. KACC 23026]WEG10823.1 polysaccharide deacetylase family protein [Pullulanibacillus sp. KACC 23026]
MRTHYTWLFMIVVTFVISFWLSLFNPALAFIPDRSYYEKRGDIVWEVPTEKKWIALTFDDGPDPTYTPEILDILKEYHAKATFFVIGKHILEHPNLVQREVMEGHDIENHTFSHIRLQQMTNETFLKDIKMADKTIDQFQPYRVKLFRPPGGALNLNEDIIEALKENHMEIVLWSWHQDTNDWKRPGASRIAQHVIKNAHNGDIVILHDAGGDRSQTVNALKQILPELEKQGYQFVTVSNLLRTCPKYQFLFQQENPLSPAPSK